MACLECDKLIQMSKLIILHLLTKPGFLHLFSLLGVE